MAKRPRSPVNSSGRTAKRTAQHGEHQKHLYLVVDDWERGYSVCRIDEDDFDSEPCQDDARPVESPFVRMEAQHPHSLFFVAHGTKILAMQPNEWSPGIPAFDTETLGVSTFPSSESRGHTSGNPVCASVGNRLLVFNHPFAEVLGPEPTPSSEDDTEEPWCWTNVDLPPFESSLVSGYAVHPDGRTIFVSVIDWTPGVTGRVFDFSPSKARNSTFTFDMERLEWTHVGEWVLPFDGRGFYDRELDAWVGICYSKGTGHVCSCDVPRASGCEDMPAWKLGRDVLYDIKVWRLGYEEHMGATLVYKGDSRFCLLESRMPTNAGTPCRIRTVKMTSFALKYDKEGHLRCTNQRAHASVSYQIAHKLFDRNHDPVAFWM